MVPLELRRAGYVLPFHRVLALTEPAWGAVVVRLPPSRRVIFGWFVGMAGLDGLAPAMGREMLRDSGRAAHVVRGVLGPLANLDLPVLARRVSAPGLVLWGDRDAGGWQSGPPLAAALGATEVVLPGVGHMPMLEAPYAFTTAVREFLSATVPP
jgi:pimeloyl-ACP methyl ester carboxylesterase